MLASSIPLFSYCNGKIFQSDNVTSLLSLVLNILFIIAYKILLKFTLDFDLCPFPHIRHICQTLLPRIPQTLKLTTTFGLGISSFLNLNTFLGSLQDLLLGIQDPVQISPTHQTHMPEAFFNLLIRTEHHLTLNLFIKEQY